jgi:hypothetical protein
MRASRARLAISGTRSAFAWHRSQVSRAWQTAHDAACGTATSPCREEKSSSSCHSGRGKDAIRRAGMVGILAIGR